MLQVIEKRILISQKIQRLQERDRINLRLNEDNFEDNSCSSPRKGRHSNGFSPKSYNKHQKYSQSAKRRDRRVNPIFN